MPIITFKSLTNISEYLNILLADDDEDDRVLFADAIAEVRVKTKLHLLTDGVQTMNYLLNEQNILPDILFLDINMPFKTGIECLEEIRNNVRLKHLAIAIYSTSSTEKDIEETFVKGANIYIRKPNNFNDLKRIMKEVITLNWQYHTSGLNKENFLLNI
jgi:CheY-like chemotaxis protein